MRRSLPFISATLVLFAGYLPAAQITTLIAGASERQGATLSARRIDGIAASIEQQVTVPSTADLELPPGLWEIRVVSPAWWAAPVYLRNTDSAEVKLWATIPLTGSGKDLSALRLQFTSRDAAAPSGEAGCESDRQSWTCRLPPGQYDLRFSSTGSAPEYRWGVTISADQKQADLRLHFVPGASLSGRVEAARGARVSIEGAEITLVTASVSDTSSRHTARTDAKGFFQFKGLPPGDYTVRAAQKGAAAQSESVKVLAGLAAELNAPLLLDTPKRLTVFVAPRIDPGSSAWRVRLSSHDRRLRRGEIVSESEVSATGDWTHPALIAGEYTIEILTASGHRWKSEEVTIARDDVTIPVAALATQISGAVTLGDRPLQASLSFGGEGGPKLQSDADGRFEGHIAHDDHEERVILVEADTPRVKRTVRAKINRNESGELRALIHLPATTLAGRVLNEDRSPARNGMVTVTGDRPHTFEQTFTEADGSFQIGGYEPGNYRVTADAFGRSSKSLDVELRKNEPADVELILEPYERVQGRVTAGQAPAISAEIYALPRDAWGPTIPSARSDESGRFQLNLPPGTKTFDFLSVHPAFDVLFARTTLVKDKQLQIRMTQFGGTVVVEGKTNDVIVIRNGAEMAAAWLANEAGGTLAPGRITIPRLVPSQYFVCTRDRKICASGYLPPHGTLTLSLTAE